MERSPARQAENQLVVTMTQDVLVQKPDTSNGFPIRIPEPFSLVIFGASGDLTHRKLIPALYNLFRKARLPEAFHVIGFSRTPHTDEQFRGKLEEAVRALAHMQIDEKEWEEFAGHLYYCTGDLSSETDLKGLHQFIRRIEGQKMKDANRVYYLAISPQYYGRVVAGLGKMSMEKQKNCWRRIVVEKPFGRDLASAQELNQSLHRVFDEQQIFRIDHYLGKETAQNILFFRFANTIFEPIWNRNYIDHVQITVAEDIPVGHRGSYYDEAGVLRDMFQNHLLHLLALMTMEPPASFNADAVRNEIMKLFSAIRPIPAESVRQSTVRGQYAGYHQEKGVSPDSETATFGAVRLFVDNWRWQGVPLYLRSGKALTEKCSQIILKFNPPPHVMFPLPHNRHITPNLLVLRIQPQEGIDLRFEAKVPDTIAEMRSVEMEFDYDSSFGQSILPDAYERLLMDLLLGDASLFARNDAIELAWRFIDPIQNAWDSDLAPPLEIYQPGTWGPQATDHLIGWGGDQWINGF